MELITKLKNVGKWVGFAYDMITYAVERYAEMQGTTKNTIDVKG